MSILQTRNLAGRNEFLLQVQKGFILMKEAIKREKTLNTIVGDETDKQNFLLLKKQLGMERQELMLRQLMTKNNDNNNQDIANNFNKSKYELVVKYNDMICLFLLYFIHEATWLKQPEYAYDATLATFQTNITEATRLADYTADRSQPTGIPYDMIFDKVKKVLPFLSNLFMELIEDKFPTGTSVQVSEYQQLQERLDQAQLLGQIKKESKMVKKTKN
ncbi:hypothetical protein ABPG72_005881 [Tetrahymena utriculariae]